MMRRAGTNFAACVKHEPLLFATLTGVVLGAVAGCILNTLRPDDPDTLLKILGFPGKILMRSLRLLVLPLIAGSMIAGVCSLRDSTFGMGKVARVTIGYYFLTTISAVTLGVLTVSIIRPGRGQPFKNLTSKAAEKPEKDPNLLDAILGIIEDLFPPNAVSAAVDMNILGIISISILFGLGLAAQGSEADELVRLVNSFNKTIEKIVIWILWIAPFGIFSLIMYNIGKSDDLVNMLSAMGLFVATVVLGLAIHSLLILPAIYFAFTRRMPWQHYWGFTSAFVTAFGTDSSSATLPVTMKCATEEGAHDEIIKFVLPLGATVNMNGTALYEAVAVLFIAQANDVHLSIADTIVVALVAALAAMGAAGIPEAGLVTMLLVLKAAGMEQYSSDVGVLFTIDWFLDRCRTTVNVLGDALGTMAVDSVMYGGRPQKRQPVEPAYGRVADQEAEAEVGVAEPSAL